MAQWTDAEKQLLKAGVADGKSDKVVAQMLPGRTARGVANKRRELRLVRSGGRPKRKRLTVKERAQRRVAAIKTGEHSDSPMIAAGVPVCKADRCPNTDGFPCSLRDEIDARGGAIEVCLPAIVEESEAADAYRRALTDQDDATLRELTIKGLAVQEMIYERAACDVLRHGVTHRVPIIADDGETVLGHHVKLNPAAPFVFGTLAANLGYTRAAQGFTATTKAEAKAGEGMLSLSKLLAGKAGAFAKLLAGKAGAFADAGGGA